MSDEAPNGNGDRTRRRRQRGDEGESAETAAPVRRDALPEEGLSVFAKEAREGLRSLLARMAMTGEVNVVGEDEEQVQLDVVGDDAQHLVGKKGQVLDAIQMVLNKIVKRQAPGALIVVDAEGYRERRTESLVKLALRLKDEAISSKRVVALNPMSARDRRIIHMTLRDEAGVSTRSEGEGLERRLLIVPEA